MRKLEHRRILITGGAGFIGSNLAERLLAQDNEIVVLDNFLTGKRENVAPFEGNPHFRLIVGDIRDKATCREAVDGIDLVPVVVRCVAVSTGSVAVSHHDGVSSVPLAARQ